MSEKPLDEVVRLLKGLLGLAPGSEDTIALTQEETRTILHGIREMQEEIKQGKKVMLEAVEFIEKGKEGDAWRIIVDLLAKD